jgi:hypothetical protein
MRADHSRILAEGTDGPTPTRTPVSWVIMAGKQDKEAAKQAKQEKRAAKKARRAQIFQAFSMQRKDRYWSPPHSNRGCTPAWPAIPPWTP